MKGISVAEFGGPDVMKLADIAMPEAKEGEVLVKVYAAGRPQPCRCMGDRPDLLSVRTHGVSTGGHAPALRFARGQALPASYSELIRRYQSRGDVQARGDVCQAPASCAPVYSRCVCTHFPRVGACVITGTRNVVTAPRSLPAPLYHQCPSDIP